MRSNTIKLLLIVFLVVVGLIALNIYLPKLRRQPSLYQKKIASIDKNSISTIEISKKEKSVTLKKQDNLWKINDKKANSASVNSLLAGFFSDNTELISETNRQHENLELTEEKATKVKLDDKLSFLVGKSGAGGLYIRFADSDAVFLAKDLSTSDVSTDANDWYDKTIVEIDSNKIKKLTFKKPSETFTVVKDEQNNWKFEENDKKVNQEKIRSISSSLSLLSARSLAEAADLSNYSNYPDSPDLTLTLDYNSQTETLKFYGSDDDYLVSRASDKENFIISSITAETFLISSQDLLAESE